jgi:hypothetical protein
VAANKPDGRRNLGIQAAANTASVYPSVFAALGVWLAPEKKARGSCGHRLDEVDTGDGLFE